MISQTGHGVGAALEYEGDCASLRGIHAWESQATGKPKQAYQACPNGADSDDRITISMLHAASSGVKAVAPAELAREPTFVIATPKRRGGCPS